MQISRANPLPLKYISPGIPKGNKALVILKMYTSVFEIGLPINNGLFGSSI